ncbi:MAG TPA: hypothetical protein VN549_00670 [Negativicutes bacterium]|nr:hypothetical protein [Negativicutes bacterium]
MGYAILNKRIEMGSRSGPCIVVRTADKESTDKRQELIDALKTGDKSKFMQDNGLSEKSIHGMHSTMTYFPRTVNNVEALKKGWKLKEYLKYAEELYHDGLSMKDSIKKAMRVIYGRI